MTSSSTGRADLDTLRADFMFGTATAALVTDGRPPAESSLSIWDVFAAAAGRITDGTTPADGPRQSEHLDEDLALLAQLGVDGYRTSLFWHSSPERMIAELDRVDRLVDALFGYGIRPVLTLCHYDMPLEVMGNGGWLIRDTAELFADWAGRVAARLADRVDHWITMNAPLVHTSYGYGLGVDAPGLTLLAESLHAGRWQLVGHGLAVAALRAGGARQVGIANAHTRVRPAGDSDADRAAAAMFDALHNRAFTDPLFGLPWPAELGALPGAPGESFTESDAAIVAAPLDFYGVNYYHPQKVAADPANATIPFALLEAGPGDPADEFGWPTDPTALTDTLTTLTARLPGLPPLWVTENGTQDSGGLDDTHRSRYLEAHVGAVVDAVRAGADVRGYFHWTLLDGWEFAEGLTRRFGLVAVDPQTRVRTPKASYRTYQELLGRRRQV